MFLPDDNDYYIGGKTDTKDPHRGSNLSKYGSMNVSMGKSGLNGISYGESLTGFQQELERITQKTQFKAQKRYLERKKRTFTQVDEEGWRGRSTGRVTTPLSANEIAPITVTLKKDSSKHLHDQIQQIKRMVEQQRKMSAIQSKFQRLYQQIQKKNSYQHPPMPQNFMYPPNPYMYPPPNPYPYYPPSEGQRSRRSHRKPSDDFDDDILSRYEPSERKPQSKHRSTSNMSRKKTPVKPNLYNKNKLVSTLKKHFFAVTFVFFLRKDSKRLALARKANLRKFWTQKFQSQVCNMKNWMLDALKYSISIILQKKDLNFNFFQQRREKVKQQKQKLVLQLSYLSLEQMKKLCTPKDVSLFSEVLAIVCRTGSFPISRFWTVNQMQKLRISEYYGFIRANQQQQKWMIVVFVFFKVLVFNMFLQPYKFDSVNFTKTSEPLLSNMYLIASVLYHIGCEVLDEYLSEEKPQMYEPGNWLAVKKQFICECCQPLKFNTDVPEKGQYISGMIQRQVFDDMLLSEENYQKWAKIRSKMKEVVDGLYQQMKAKSKMMKGNLKYKLYN